ncbi:EamA family transporter [Spirillospora sp. CA-128828]|uniref:EamA family transporter n=1 Tax=Spirillospora sp. CA-128828 TaxID=3240033 RepID=UPI003D8B7ECA
MNKEEKVIHKVLLKRDSGRSLQPNPPIAALSMVGALGVAQGGYVLAKSLFERVAPLTVSCLQTTSAAVLMWLTIRPSLWAPLTWLPSRLPGAWGARLLTTRPTLWATWAVWRPALLLGVGNAAQAVAGLYAVQRLPLGTAMSLWYVSGPMVLATFVIIAGRRWSYLVWPGLALAGAVTLAPPWGEGLLDLVGLIAIGVNACGYAAYTLITADMADDERNPCTARAMLPTLVIMYAAQALIGGGAGIDGRVLIIAAMSGVLTAYVLPLLMNLAWELRVGKARSAVLLATEPVIGALLGLAFLSEVPATSGWIGMGLICVAGAGATLTKEDGLIDN